MHSRIFGIIKKDNYDKIIKEEGKISIPIQEFEQNLPYVMNYVSEETNLDEDIEWLINELKVDSNKFKYNSETHTIKFYFGFAEDYFKKKWEYLKELVETENAFRQFCRSDSFSFEIRDTAESYYEFYQCNEKGYYSTFDGFVRALDYDVEYVIFGSLDYCS